jgi:hypothetical protein
MYRGGLARDVSKRPMPEDGSCYVCAIVDDALREESLSSNCIASIANSREMNDAKSEENTSKCKITCSER